MAVFGVNPVEKQPVVVYIQIQRGAKALHESYRSTLGYCIGNASIPKTSALKAITHAYRSRSIVYFLLFF
jgi:hypothetical protein